jgi:hypothetical protein
MVVLGSHAWIQPPVMNRNLIGFFRHAYLYNKVNVDAC